MHFIHVLLKNDTKTSIRLWLSDYGDYSLRLQRTIVKYINNIQLLDQTEQNIVIYQWRADQLFADAEGRGK